MLYALIAIYLWAGLSLAVAISLLDRPPIGPLEKLVAILPVFVWPIYLFVKIIEWFFD